MGAQHGNSRRDFLRSSVALGSVSATAGTAGTAPSEMRTFRLASVAMRSHPVSPQRNLRHIEQWLVQAQGSSVELVCFPELSVTGYLTTSAIWEAAEPVPGPSTAKLEEMASGSGLTVCAGIAEKDKGIVYDTYVFVGPRGYLGKSRKIHIPPAEVGYWRGGGVPPVIDIGLARVGVNICFDNWLPESSRLVALQGAQVIFAPFVWAVGKWGDPPDHTSRNRDWKDYAGRTFPARAIDNGVFLVAMNSVGPVPNGASTYYGNPVVLIYGPDGKLIAESPDNVSEEVMVVAELDRSLLVARRSQGVFHPRFRRPELYGLLAEGDIGRQDSR